MLSCIVPCRRQVEHVIPALFDAAVSGNTELLYKVLEDGDNVNPLVSHTFTS